MTPPRELPVLALNILLAASRDDTGVRVRDLVTAVERFEGRSRSAARVLITRTSRQLWALGLVELHGRHVSETMTELVASRHEVAARAYASPQSFYNFCVALRGGDDPWGEPMACVRAKAAWAQRRPRLHVRRISITERGRAQLSAVLDSAGSEILPPAGISDSSSAAF